MSECLLDKAAVTLDHSNMVFHNKQWSILKMFECLLDKAAVTLDHSNMVFHNKQWSIVREAINLRCH
jgi:hypothetical protein